jgi:hypothetical protein
MQIETQFSIFLVNKPGVLAGVAGALARAKVNLMALTLSDSGEHGVLRIVCDNPEAARKVLGQAHDRWTETEVLVMDLDNKPGAFARLAQELADEHINISYAYCTGGAPKGKVTAVFKVADLKKAVKVLEERKTARKQDKRTIKPPPKRKS